MTYFSVLKFDMLKHSNLKVIKVFKKDFDSLEFNNVL